MINLVKDSIHRFTSNKDKLLFKLSQIEFKNQQDFDLNYHTPMDVVNTKFPENHFDFYSSEATMEQIAPDDILNETYRIMKKGGTLSMTIDYRDHCVYFDKSLSFYNFLQFSDKEWKQYNPSLNYQKRLQHSDYLEIISKTNFKIVKNAPSLPTCKQQQELKNVKLASMYKNYSYSDLEILGSKIVLLK